MEKYKMLIIFNSEDLKKMNRGQIARWTLGAGMFLSHELEMLYKDCKRTNKYGEASSDWDVGYFGKYIEWLNQDYRSIVLQTDAPLLNLFDSLVKSRVPCYCQANAHQHFTVEINGVKTIKYKTAALACFLSDDKARELGLDKLELLK